VSSPAPTTDSIRAWLLARLRERLGAKTPLDADRPLADYGLDSLAAIAITADLEDWLEVELEPTMFFDYPSIDELARFLKDELESTA